MMPNHHVKSSKHVAPKSVHFKEGLLNTSTLWFGAENFLSPASKRYRGFGIRGGLFVHSFVHPFIHSELVSRQ